METYLAEMHKNSEGKYANFITEVGSDVIARTEPDIHAYLESKHLAQAEASTKLNIKMAEQAYENETDPNKKKLIREQINRDVSNLIALGLAPKNTLKSVAIGLDSIDANHYINDLISSTSDARKLDQINLFLASGNPDDLLKTNFSDIEVRRLAIERRQLDSGQRNKLKTAANQRSTLIDENEAREDALIRNKVQENELFHISDAINFTTEWFNSEDTDPSDKTLTDMGYEIYEDFVDRNPNIALSSPTAKKVKQEILNTLVNNIISPAFRQVTNKNLQRIVGSDAFASLIFNQYWNTPSENRTDEVNKLIGQLKGTPQLKILMNTFERLAKEGVPSSSLSTIYRDRRSSLANPLTQTQIKKQALIESLETDGNQPDNGSPINSTSKEVKDWTSQYIAKNLGLGNNWATDLDFNTLMSNPQFTSVFNNSLKQGILPSALEAELKKAHPSEAALRLGFLAMNVPSYSRNEMNELVRSGTRNVLTSNEGMSDISKKLFAIGAALQGGMAGDKSFQSLGEAWATIGEFKQIDPNSTVTQMLSRRVSLMDGYDKLGKNIDPYQALQKDIDKWVFAEGYGEVILAQVKSQVDYMIMVGAEFTDTDLKKTIDSYLEANVGMDGVVVDSTNYNNPGKSIFSLDKVFPNAGIALAFVNSLEHKINAGMPEGSPVYMFMGLPGFNREFGNEVLKNERINFDRGDPNNLNDDRFVARHITEGGKEVLVEKRGGHIYHVSDGNIKLGNLFNEKSAIGMTPVHVGGYNVAVAEKAYYQSDDTLLKAGESLEVKQLYLHPLGTSLNKGLRGPDSYFDIRYLIVEKAPGGGFRAFKSPDGNINTIVSPKDFRGAVDSYSGAFELAHSMTEAETKAFEMKLKHKNDPDWIPGGWGNKVKETNDAIIRLGISLFQNINKSIHDAPIGSRRNLARQFDLEWNLGEIKNRRLNDSNIRGGLWDIGEIGPAKEDGN
tara:strand:- start:906 stop:3779 length:2874 start_codon:yes stop_codon:yes gene_type:complete